MWAVLPVWAAVPRLADVLPLLMLNEARLRPAAEGQACSLATPARSTGLTLKLTELGEP